MCVASRENVVWDIHERTAVVWWLNKNGTPVVGRNRPDLDPLESIMADPKRLSVALKEYRRFLNESPGRKGMTNRKPNEVDPPPLPHDPIGTKGKIVKSPHLEAKRMNAKARIADAQAYHDEQASEKPDRLVKQRQTYARTKSLKHEADVSRGVISVHDALQLVSPEIHMEVLVRCMEAIGGVQ